MDVFENGSPQYYSGDLSAPAVGVKWQCVELPQRLYQSLGWHTGMFPVAVATEIYTKAAQFGMVAHPNGSGYVPVPGDMVVMTGGGTFHGVPIGHVAVVNRVSDCDVFLVEQNWSNTGRASLSRTGWDGTTLSSRGGYDVLGIVHSPKNTLQSPPTNAPQTASAADGRLVVLMRGRDGAIYSCTQAKRSGAWGRWVRLGGSVVGNPIVVRDAQGRLQFFARGADGVLHGRRQVAPGGGWSGWTSLGMAVGSDPVLAVGADGSLQIAARGEDGALSAATQPARSADWTPWAVLDGSTAGSTASPPSLGVDADGGLEVFVRNADNSIADARQAAGGQWLPWANAGGRVMGRPVTGRDAGGLRLFVLGTDGLVYQKSRSGPSAPWSDWSALPTAPVPGMGDPALATNPDGSLQLFVRGVDRAVYTIRQTSPGVWSAWANLGGQTDGPLSVAADADGRLELFLRDTDGVVDYRRQTTPGGRSWSAWTPLGTAHPLF